jgi:dipeptidyl-peptidase-4
LSICESRALSRWQTGIERDKLTLMKNTILTSALATLILSPALAEEKQPVNDKPLDAAFLRLYAETRGFMLGRPSKPKPTPDGKAVLFLRSEPKKAKMSLYEFDVATGRTKELLTPEALLKGAEENLSPEEKARRERMRISVGGFTDYQLSDDGKRILTSLSGKLYVIDRDSGKATELTTGKGTLLDPKFSPDGSKVSYVLDHDVFVYDLATNKESQVTKGGTEKKTHGLAEFVAQEEMYRYAGYWWSPDNKFIAYEEADHEGVEQWFVADSAKPDQPPLPQYYPRPGKKNVAVRLGIIPVMGGDTVWVEWDVKKYEYLASVRWDRHGPLTIQVVDRLQQNLLLLRVDPKTGKSKQLISEKDKAFLDVRQDVPRWLPGAEQFVWVTERHGASEPELITLGDGNEPERKSLIKPEWGFQRLVGIDSKGTRFVGEFIIDPRLNSLKADRFWDKLESSVGMNYFKEVGMTGPRGLGPQGASIAINDDHSLDVISHADLEHMPRSTAYTRDEYGIGKAVGVLPSIALEPESKPNITPLHLENGTTHFYATILRPHDFDPTKKYPVILDVYGGPHHRHVNYTMGPWLLKQWLADQGFIVVAIDNRGTPGRGRDWERAIYQKFDTVPLDDQVKGLQLLGAKYPEMDIERIGVTGWSFGGYMSALAVLKRPDVFKAAVAGAPVTDWEDYDTFYTERYLGLLPESKKAYDDANLVKMADKLTRPLMLIHGTADDNVYFRHTLRLTDALFRAGKDFDVLPLPSLTHMASDPVVTERMWTKVAGYFQKHLGKAT